MEGCSLPLRSTNHPRSHCHCTLPATPTAIYDPFPHPRTHRYVLTNPNSDCLLPPPTAWTHRACTCTPPPSPPCMHARCEGWRLA